MIRPQLVFLSLTALLLTATVARAQDAAAAQPTLTISGGVMDFDLSGTGQTWVAGVRFIRPFTSHLAIEIGTSYARPEQDFGETTLFAPDFHLQYHWKIGPVRPFIGAGAGFVHISGPFDVDDTDPTFSAAGGLRVDIGPRASLFGEMRVRGHERGFVATTAEWSGGLSFRFGGS